MLYFSRGSSTRTLKSPFSWLQRFVYTFSQRFISTVTLNILTKHCFNASCNNNDYSIRKNYSMKTNEQTIWSRGFRFSYLFLYLTIYYFFITIICLLLHSWHLKSNESEWTLTKDCQLRKAPDVVGTNDLPSFGFRLTRSYIIWQHYL